MTEPDGKDELRKAIKSFADVKTLVIGDLMGDKYIWGGNMRLSKEAPVPVIQVQQEVYELGGAAHVAHNASLLGAQIYLCGLVGFDDAAHSLRTAITEAGIDSGGIFPTTERPTTLKVRVMSLEYNTHLVRFDYESTKPLTEDEMATLQRYLKSYMDEINVIIISDYAKGIFNHEEFVQLTIKTANKANIPTIVDTKPVHFNRFKDASVIICTLKEAREFIQMTRFTSIPGINDLGETIIDAIGCNCLAIIQEEKGFQIDVFGEKRFSADGVTKKLYDSVGLEDTVTSVLALGLASGLNLQRSMDLVMRAISIVASKPGTGVITKNELLSTL